MAEVYATHDHHHSGDGIPLAHHFESVEQQYDASLLGMWTFLLTELMLFAGLFTAYAVYRVIYTDAFRAASHHLHADWGAFNTAVLICSSLAMALAVHAAQEKQQRQTVLWLLATIALGVAFLGIKSYEYYMHYHEGLMPGPNFHWEEEGVNTRPLQLFYMLYFIMTGTHAAHMIIGLTLIGVIAFRAWRGHFNNGHYMPVELMGLYWHFVDLVWVFIFPLLYLIGRH